MNEIWRELSVSKNIFDGMAVLICITYTFK